MFFASFACSEFVGKRLKNIEGKQIPAQGPDMATWLSQSARSSVRVFHPRWFLFVPKFWKGFPTIPPDCVKLFQRSIWLSKKAFFFNQNLVVSWQFLMHFGTPESANVIRCGLIDVLFLFWKAGWCAVWMWRVVGWEDSCFHLFWQKHYWRVKEPTETVTVR